MNKLIALSFAATMALAAPAQAQFFGSGNGGLLGLGNANILGVQTGHVSILNGGILNGSNVLSGIGLGSAAYAGNSSTNTTGSGHVVIPGNSGMIVPGSGNVIGTGNVVGAGNTVGNQWGHNFNKPAFSNFSW